MQRLSIVRLRPLGRRSVSKSPELPRRSNNPDTPRAPLSNSSFLAGDVSPAAEILAARRPHFIFASIPNLNQQLLTRGRSLTGNDHLRRFSSINETDERALEEDAERKVGWLLKIIFVATASLVAFEFFPYMGDTLLQQSISLLHVKDPLFKRMGASRLTRYAVDDERRMKVVEMGGAQQLVIMLAAAKDDKTRKEALKALFTLSHSNEAVDALHQAGAIPIIRTTPNSLEYSEVATYKSNLLKRFEQLKHDVGPLEGVVV